MLSIDLTLCRSSDASTPSSMTPSLRPPGDARSNSGVPPDLEAVRSRSTEETSTLASSSGQWGLIMTSNQASTDQIFSELWKCAFCNQTYNRQNTFDQVYHTRGHQNEV